MKKVTLTILLVAAVAATWAQKPDKKTMKLEKQLVGTFVEIPAGHYTEYIRDTNMEVYASQEITLAGFRMLETEVSNKVYDAFLEDLKAQGRMKDYESARVHNEGWAPWLDRPVDEFLQNQGDWAPVYANCPVVNISYESAQLFCQWLNEKIASPEWEYMLPTREQWRGAASCGDPNASYSNGSPFLETIANKPRYNYWHVPEMYISRTDDGYKVMDLWSVKYHIPPTVPVKTYYRNAYGLYNMCGNAAEMVDERGVAIGGSWYDPGYDIRIDSEKRYDGPSPLIGFRVIAVRKK